MAFSVSVFIVLGSALATSPRPSSLPSALGEWSRPDGGSTSISVEVSRRSVATLADEAFAELAARGWPVFVEGDLLEEASVTAFSSTDRLARSVVVQRHGPSTLVFRAETRFTQVAARMVPPETNGLRAARLEGGADGRGVRVSGWLFEGPLSQAVAAARDAATARGLARVVVQQLPGGARVTATKGADGQLEVLLLQLAPRRTVVLERSLP